MKKVFLILLSFLTISTSFSQTKSTSDSTQTEQIMDVQDVSKNPDLNSKMYEGVKEFMVATASNLKVTTEHVYEVMVKQQVVYGVMYIIVFVLAMILMFLSISLGNKVRWGGDDVSFRSVATVLLGVMSFVLFLIALCNLDTIVTGIINPEMGAIKEIMNFIKDLNMNQQPPKVK